MSKRIGLNKIIIGLVLYLLIWMVFPGAVSADVPIHIFPSNHWGAASLQENKIYEIVKNNFELDDTILYKVKIKVLYNESGHAEYLIVYLLSKINYSYKTARVNLGGDYTVLSIESNYQESKNEYNSGDERFYATCPDETIDMVFATCEDGVQSASQAITECGEIAENSGFKVKILKGSQENTTAVKNWLACENLILFGRIGHGTTTGLILDDGTLSYSYFQGLSSTALNNKVVYTASCQTHNNPFEPAIVNAGVQKYIGGNNDLIIGVDEGVMTCFLQRTINGEAMTPTVDYCQSQVSGGGSHGISGNGSEYLSDNPDPDPDPDPDNYCDSRSNNQNYEYIGQVDVGSFSNTSDASPYSDFTSRTINMAINTDYSVELTPKFTGSAYTEYWSIWVDLNQDGDFEDSGENLVQDSGNSGVTGTMKIPEGTSSGKTRMRISMKYNGSSDPCETFTYGEVEDYTVNITAGNDSPDQYCESQGGSQYYEYIKEVTVGSFSNPSDTSPYSDFTSMTVKMNKGTAYPIILAPEFSGSSFTENWRIWIDLNQDGDFEDTGENVFEDSGGSDVTGSIAIPSSASSGNTRMRVSMGYNGYYDACETIPYGEVEDYTIVIE